MRSWQDNVLGVDAWAMKVGSVKMMKGSLKEKTVVRVMMFRWGRRCYGRPAG